ncbi:MAG: Fe-S cluster assembly protein SufD [Candidatus Omnitrophica bacterium]|nr:Fe-S cluster assembly protein SufD [Candidatus Omnitrophota bacterium]
MTETLARLSEREGFLKAVEAGWKSDAPAGIAGLRKQAAGRLAALDFPTQASEEWRYTSVEPLLRAPYHFARVPASAPAKETELAALAHGPVAGRLVFVNGFLSRELSTLHDLPGGVRVLGLREAWKAAPGVLEKHLAKYAPHDRETFTALNTAALCDGALVHLEKDAALAAPLSLIFITAPGKENPLIQPRNLIVAEAGSKATVIEHYFSLSPDPYFTNTVLEIALEENASLDHYQLQQEGPQAFHVGMTQAALGPSARFASTVIDAGGSLVRNNLQVRLEGEQASCVLNGLSLVAGSQHVDNFTVIDHLRPHGTSRQVYKAVLDDRASAVFYGKIFVRRDAQKTDAAQKNKSLLLSEGAKVDTRPQLEISADDVKCAHGAAVGQLDEDEIFYLRSRGLSDQSAKRLLTYGFANEIISAVPLESLRENLEGLLMKRLGQS